MAWKVTKSVLVLTDHKSHYPQESIYSFCNAILDRPETSRVVVVSRGNIENGGFFYGDQAVLYGKNLEGNFHRDSWSWVSGIERFNVNDFDLTLLRLDRPFDVHAAATLQSKLQSCPFVFNGIGGILKTRLKSFVASFDRFVPPSRLCMNEAEAFDFFEIFDDAVLKPDDGYAAKGVVRVTAGQMDGAEFTGPIHDYFATLRQDQDWPRVAVKFLRGISAGDKRLLIANGRLISCVLRIPRADRWLVNYDAGRTTMPSLPTKRELDIIEYVSEKIYGLNVLIYSIDTVEGEDGERLISEINSLNAGLLPLEHGANQFIDAQIAAAEIMRAAALVV